MKYRFFFVGKIPSKANYKRISHRRICGEMKPFIINNGEVLKAQKEALYQLHLQKLEYGLENFPIKKPVKLSVSFYFAKRMKQRDIDNAEKFVGDILEKAEVLKRDSLIYVKERVEKKVGLKGFEEIIVVDLEELSEEEVERQERRLELNELPEGFKRFLKLMKMEITDED